jgi:two-component system sensor histidine kinase KdpD
MPGDGRGHYKIFLGMAAGVGKTYRMLQEGQAEKAAGRDVAIGYLEPHDRPETAAQAAGLEQLPRRRVSYRGAELEEMDLPAIFRRAPDLCLIDELAHTNPPGLEHRKRYEDIEDVLDAGIDVFSTVNVQHLESLNDRVADLTGVRVHETFPDNVLTAADEVVLVDLTPEALLQRLRAGKVYPAERVQASLDNFFRIENLGALREVALRQVAEDVESRRSVPAVPQLGTRTDDGDDADPVDGPKAVAEHVLALVAPRERSRRLVRRAWRSAQRLDAELDLLCVTTPGTPPRGDAHEQLEALRRLASELGARLLVEEGDDIAAVAARVATERDVTYLMIGRPRPRRGLRRLGESLPERLLRLLPGVDVRIVADQSRPLSRRPSAAATAGSDDPWAPDDTR